MEDQICINDTTGYQRLHITPNVLWQQNGLLSVHNALQKRYPLLTTASRSRQQQKQPKQTKCCKIQPKYAMPIPDFESVFPLISSATYIGHFDAVLTEPGHS